MKRKRSSKYKQGIFVPKNKHKYKGTFPIIYRSSYELRFQKWADHNTKVISWGSESIIVPYSNPLTGSVSRYFVDFNVTMLNKQGMLEKFLVEIKPHNQTLPPVQTRSTKTLARRQAEYVKNQAKWKAATEWGVKKGYQFVVLTEKHLNI